MPLVGEITARMSFRGLQLLMCNVAATVETLEAVSSIRQADEDILSLSKDPVSQWQGPVDSPQHQEKSAAYQKMNRHILSHRDISCTPNHP